MLSERERENGAVTRNLDSVRRCGVYIVVCGDLSSSMDVCTSCEDAD